MSATGTTCDWEGAARDARNRFVASGLVCATRAVAIQSGCAMPPTAGLILAGGLSRRMGGVRKCLLEVGEVAILRRVAGVLAPQCAPLLLNANGDAAAFAGYGLPVVPDTIQGFAGPLAGVLAGLEHLGARHPGIAWLASLAGDGPFPPEDFVARLHAARGSAAMACAASGGRTHPVAALWPAGMAGALRDYLDGGGRRVNDFVEGQGAAVAEWDVGDHDPFFNINTPEDLAQANASRASLAPSGS